MLETSAVLEVLKPVQDPELRKSLVELNMIRNIQVDGGIVKFTVVLTTPACPMKDMIHNAATPAIQVDSETYEVRADGELLTCEPLEALPLAQRYFLF